MPITDAELVDRAKDLLVKPDPVGVDQFTLRGLGMAWWSRRPWSTCGSG